MVQTNKSLKQANKDTNQKLEEALKQNELLTQENERLKKLLEEYQNGSNNINKKIPDKKYHNKEESSENEEEKEKDEEKEEEKDEEKEDENEMEGRGEEESHSQSDEDSKKIIVKSPKKIISKLVNKNLLTNEVIADILERVSELEKFRIFMEASAQTTDSKISFLESRIANMSRRSSEDIGVPTTINTKENKMIPPIISKSLHRINEVNEYIKDQNDDILLSKSLTNQYNYNNQKI